MRSTLIDSLRSSRENLPGPGRAKVTTVLKSRKVVPLYFIAPFYVLYIAFFAYPLLWAPWMSFQRFTFDGLEFVGLEHYQTLLLGDSLFPDVVFNTFFMAGIIVPANLVFGLVAAVLINSGFTKFRKVWRTVYLLPLVMSATILSVVFNYMLVKGGLVDLTTSQLFGFTIDWLTDEFWAKISVAGVSTWRQLGLSTLIFLAGLQSIPEDMYKAAKMDGANRLEQFWHITIPQLAPITLLVVILSTIGALKMFAEPFVLTSGGPGSASKTIVFLLYQKGFQELQLGMATAIGTLLTAILGGIMAIQYTIGTRRID